jgi:hypothetical protein
MLLLAEVRLLEQIHRVRATTVLRTKLDELPCLTNNVNIAQRIVRRGQLPPDIS